MKSCARRVAEGGRAGQSGTPQRRAARGSAPCRPKMSRWFGLRPDEDEGRGLAGAGRSRRARRGNRNRGARRRRPLPGTATAIRPRRRGRPAGPPRRERPCGTSSAQAKPVRCCARVGAYRPAVQAPRSATSAAIRSAEFEATTPLPEKTAVAPPPYLDAAGLIARRPRAACDAVPPRLTVFLAERADFARACHAADLVFIGPTPEHLDIFGDKAQSRELPPVAGVPLLPARPPSANSLRAGRHGGRSGRRRGHGQGRGRRRRPRPARGA